MDEEPAVLDPCGCCADPEPETELFNRPGLPALDYRIGVHGSFLRRMLRRLPTWRAPDQADPPALAHLTTRQQEDPSIALLDAWATVADVLTFYQERIATEGFLRTATERRSVLELARTIGYELGPGVAAGTFLAFRVEDRPPPPGMGPPITQSVVPMGTRVQSMPGQGELPQTFETSTELVARPEWNALRPRLRRPQPVSLGSTTLYVAGVTTGLKRGDRVLIATPAPGEEEGRGAQTSVMEVKLVAPEIELERTHLELQPVPKVPPKSRPPAPTPLPVKLPPFVKLDPPKVEPLKPPQKPEPTFVLQKRPLTAEEIKNQVLRRRWRDRDLRVQFRVHGWKRPYFEDHLDYLRERAELDFIEELVEVPPPPDTRPPIVTAFFPGRDATKVHLETVITVTFDEAMNEASVKQAVRLRKHGESGFLTGDDDVNYDPATATATLKPGAPLDGQETYDVVVSTAAEDVAVPPNRLATEFTWSFTTADTTPPRVTEVSPKHDEGDVDPATVLTAKFNEDVKETTVEKEGAFQLLDSTGIRVPATVSAVGAKEARLTPKRRLAESTRYTAVVTGEITDTSDIPLTPFVWSFVTEDRPPDPPPSELAVYAFRERAGFFGASAPRHGGLPDPEFVTKNPYPADWDDPPRTIWTDSQGGTYGGDKVFLERAIPNLEEASWAVFESADGLSTFWVANVAEQSLADFALSGRATELTLSQSDGASPSKGIGHPLDFKVRETTAHLQSERLTLAELPVEEDLEAGDRILILDRMVLGLDPGRPLVLSGERSDLPGVVDHEVLLLEDSVHDGGFTVLTFQTGLAQGYVRRTATLSANVVAATHGETVAGEILGGGDGSQPNQRFVLRKPPLTHTSAPTPSGAESTLEVRVDDVLWEEARTLHDLGPRDQRYVTRSDDTGVTSVIFGDGVRGARPPTGTENVKATYRSGIGMAGMVLADKLTLPQTRPLGIQSVTNPLEASGAEDPEQRDAARQHAPRTVLTLDRIVSLRDFQDFAAAFAGIGKAQAAELRRGEQGLVHLTVAAANGDEVAETSAVFLSLVAAIDAVRDPGITVVVESYARRFFNLEAGVLVDRRYLPDLVLEAVRATLEEAFSFERRGFGQPVTAAEVVTLIQGVAGVVMTDLDKLHPVQTAAPDAPVATALDQILTARPARLVPGGTEPAELLLANPGGIVLTERTP